MKILKNLLIGLLTLIIITTIIIWVLTKAIQPELIKNYVSSQLSALTHQNSKVEGDISWHLFPLPGLKITKIQIGTENSPANYSLTLDSLRFNLKITPLLRGKLVFNEINVDGFKININPDAPSIAMKIQDIIHSNDAKTNIAEQFAIERFLLSNGKIVINQNQKKITLSNLQVGAEQFNLNKALFPIQFKTDLSIITANEKLLKTHINFKGSTSISAELFNNPLIALQNTSIEGQLFLQNLKFKQLKINTISAQIKTRPGLLSLNPLALKLYNGESVGDLKYEFVTTKLIVNQTATNLDSSTLIYDLLNKNLLKGTMDFSIHAQANLQTTNWQENTTGKGSLTIKEGVIEAINLNKIIDDVSSKINLMIADKKVSVDGLLQLAQLNNPEFFKGITNFKLLTLQYRLQNAQLESHSLVLQTDRLQLQGDGRVDLKNQGLSGQLIAKIILTDSNLAKIQQLLGGGFPFLLKGTLTEPLVLPDLQKINPLLTNNWLADTLAKPVEKIKETLQTIFQ